MSSSKKMIDRWIDALAVGVRLSTGASARTAWQDRLEPGVQASRTMARTDWLRIVPNIDLIRDVASEFDGLPLALVCAIISRESRAGAMLDDGWGDFGNGWGVMQVDKNSHRIKGLGDPWSDLHINQGCEILYRGIWAVMQRHSDWPDWAILKGACVAYNAGIKNVQTIERMDVGTTGEDYGADVLARAGWYLDALHAEDSDGS